MIVAKRHPNIVTTNGARVSSIFGLVYIASFIHGGLDSLSMVLLFIGLLALLFLAARFFTAHHYTIPRFFEKIPEAALLYRIIRSIPSYMKSVAEMVFGKRDTVSFMDCLQKTQERDNAFQTSLRGFFTDETLPFRPSWVFIPFLNIVFLPKLFMCRTTRYVLAIGQGLAITLLAIVIGLSYSFASPVELFLLFPIFYGIASLESDVFVRIPVVYEIYALLNTFTFGLLKNTKRIRGVQKQDTAVSYKVE